MSESSNENDFGVTSLHVRRAGEGVNESVDWIVARFTPLLRTQAEYRLRGAARRICDAEDLVNEVWAVTLPRLGDLRAREGHWTPVLLKFLSTTLLFRLNGMLERYLRFSRGAKIAEPPLGHSPEEVLSAGVTSVVSGATRNEASILLKEALARLGERDREVLVLRGIEQLPYSEISQFLGDSVTAVTMRYHRAVERLRTQLSDSILDELGD